MIRNAYQSADTEYGTLQADILYARKSTFQNRVWTILA